MIEFQHQNEKKKKKKNWEEISWVTKRGNKWITNPGRF